MEPVIFYKIIFAASTLSFLSSGQENKERRGKEAEWNEVWRSNNSLFFGWLQALVICNHILHCFSAYLHFTMAHFTTAIQRSMNVSALSDVAVLLNRWCFKHGTVRSLLESMSCLHSIHSDYKCGQKRRRGSETLVCGQCRHWCLSKISSDKLNLTSHSWKYHQNNLMSRSE